MARPHTPIVLEFADLSGVQLRHPDNPASFVTAHRLNILTEDEYPAGQPGSRGTSKVTGCIQYLQVRLAAAMNHGISGIEVLESSVGGMHLAAYALLDLEDESGWTVAPEVEEAMGHMSKTSPDWFFIMTEVLADSEDGLRALDLMLTYETAGLVVFPVFGFDCEDPAAAAAVRAANLERIGFYQVPGTGYLVCDLGMKRPSLGDTPNPLKGVGIPARDVKGKTGSTIEEHTVMHEVSHEPQAVVLYTEEDGVYLGGFLGLGFWSKVDSAGQAAAVTFPTMEAAEAHIATWECGRPEGVRFVPVVPDCGEAASIASCVAAGLPGWEP